MQASDERNAAVDREIDRTAEILTRADSRDVRGYVRAQLEASSSAGSGLWMLAGAAAVAALVAVAVVQMNSADVPPDSVNRRPVVASNGDPPTPQIAVPARPSGGAPRATSQPGRRTVRNAPAVASVSVEGITTAPLLTVTSIAIDALGTVAPEDEAALMALGIEPLQLGPLSIQ